jgi:hypothetical protein
MWDWMDIKWQEVKRCLIYTRKKSISGFVKFAAREEKRKPRGAEVVVFYLSIYCRRVLFGCLTGYDAKPTKSLAENEATTALLGNGRKPEICFLVKKRKPIESIIFLRG